MKSVTQRIKEIKQPKGGYLNPRDWKIINLDDNNELHDDENIHASLIGLVVDYMTRYLNTGNKDDAFKISLMGASRINELEKAKKILKSINGLDDVSIINACRLTGYDVCYRAGIAYYKDIEEINPDEKTIFNIKIMVKRSLNFFKKYGPIIDDGITFEGGYTSIISAGDADFVTSDTLWDFKVSKNPPTKDNTLQLLIYYLLGIHSYKCDFSNVKNIGIYNPRRNCVYIYKVEDIPNDVINAVETDVIGYGSADESNRFYVTDIMKMMGCSRHIVMKYYTQHDLPLKKEKNKYYVEKNEFFKWSEEMIKRKEEQERFNRIVFTILITTFMILLLILILPQIFMYL